MAQADGRAVAMTLNVPTLELLAPASEENWLRHGHQDATYTIGTLEQVSDQQEGEAAVSYLLQGYSAPHSRLSVDGEAVEVNGEGQFSVPLRLTTGHERHYLVVDNAQGLRRIATLDLNLSHRQADGRPYYIVPPVPNVALNLPPQGVVLRNPTYTVSGQTDPGNRLEINGQAVELSGEGRSSTETNCFGTL